MAGRSIRPTESGNRFINGLIMPSAKRIPRPLVEEKISSATFGQLVAYLRSRGYSPGEIIGKNAGGRSKIGIFALIKEKINVL